MDTSTIYNKIKGSSISIDSRTIKRGDIYIAINGENFNGNTFAANAIKNGAKYAIVDEEAYCLNNQYILVSNGLKTLQELAHFHRKQFDIPLIGIAGSNGKTTTKELIIAILESKYNITGTKGNLNNHIGLPLSLLNINEDTEIAIIEMGANNSGEIKTLCKIADPTQGIITNIGKEHLEGFGDLAGVLNANAELYDYLKEKTGTIYINNGDKLLLDKAKGDVTRISYGDQESAQYRGSILQNFPHLYISFEGLEIKSNLVGNYNLENIMCAIAIGKSFEISNEDIQNCIENYLLQNNRSQLISQGTNTVILDAYNANPSSMEKAIKNLADAPGENKIVILGEMLEMGKHSQKEHQEIFDLVSSKNFKQIVLIGTEFTPFKEEQNTFYFDNTNLAKEWYKKQNYQNATILIKGSRKNKLENILN